MSQLTTWFLNFREIVMLRQWESETKFCFYQTS